MPGVKYWDCPRLLIVLAPSVESMGLAVAENEKLRTRVPAANADRSATRFIKTPLIDDRVGTRRRRSPGYEYHAQDPLGAGTVKIAATAIMRAQNLEIEHFFPDPTFVISE